MALTPEGRTKKRLNKLLDEYKVFRYMPVSNGMGAPALDYIICYNGLYAQIEVKAGKKDMTPRQKATASRVEYAGGRAFLYNDETDGGLEAWLIQHSA
jgi:hypothetical protein